MQKFWQRNEVRAVGILIGTVVGVGLFGLPYVFGQAGFLIGLGELLGLSVIMIILFLMYAEITVQTPGRHRFITYIERYLGRNGRRLASLTFITSMFGSLLAFLIIGSTFLSSLLSIGAPSAALLLLVIIGALISGGLPFVSRLEVLVVGTMLALYAILILVALPSVRLENLTSLPASGAAVLLPYGVIIFALSGFGAIPEMHDLLERQYRRLPRVLLTGYGLIVGLYALFSLAVLGASGPMVSPEAISGLAIAVHPIFIVLGSILGIISVLSVFTTVAMELQATLKIDFRLPRPIAWALTIGIPGGLYLIGLREFINVIGFIGGVLAGISALLVILAYEKLKRTAGCQEKKCFRLPTAVSVVVGAAFIFGIVIELVAFGKL